MRIVQNPSSFSVPRRGLCLRHPLYLHRREASRTNRALCVLVHGLGGARYRTWGRLPHLVYHDFPQLDVGLYGYYSGWRRLWLTRSIAVEREARVLADQLRGCDYDEIVLLGHSLGGLLCKAALSELLDREDRATLARIRALILMATPQAGVHLPLRVLSWISRDLEALRPEGALVERMNRRLRDSGLMDHSEGHGAGPQIRTFCVEASDDQWVDGVGAALGVRAENRAIVRGSHTEVVKPADRNDDVYLILCRWLRECVPELATQS